MATNIETIKYLTPDELKRILKALGSRRDRAVVLLAISLGLRISEVLLLERAHYDERAGTLLVTRLKSGAEPEVWPLHSEALRALRTYLQERGDDGIPWLFINNRGQQLQRRALDQMFRRAATKAALPSDKRHFHVLRHSCATDAISGEMPLLFVQKLLGHRQLASTLTYTRLVDPARDRMARKMYSRRRYA